MGEMYAGGEPMSSPPGRGEKRMMGHNNEDRNWCIIPRPTGLMMTNEDSSGCSDTFSSNLLPGLPDEITIDHVIARLPWRTLSTVFSVSRAWQHAITSRQVYDARVRTRSTQTLIAMTHFDTSMGVDKWTNLVSVYDTSTFKWHLLPQIPGIHRGVPNLCCCVSSQGKLYVIGGASKSDVFARNEVHSFDPTGPGKWEKCASMASPRQSFASGVKDGKIYVFGGAGADRLSEVYDPAQDEWHPIAPMLSFRLEPKVICFQNEFFLHSGMPTELERSHFEAMDEGFAEAYNIRNDEWRRIDHFSRHGHREILFEIRGKLHRIFDSQLDFYDDASMSWKVSQTISWNVLNRKGAQNVHAFPAAVVALDGELLALVYRYAAGKGVRLVPLRSDGLGMKNRELGWTKIPCSVPLQWDWLCSIQL
ncbi:unnamed protein product [Calypogeia fissa]